LPWAAATLLRQTPADQQPPATMLAEAYGRLMKNAPVVKGDELKNAIIKSISGRSTPETRAALRTIADLDESQRDMVIRTLAESPSARDWPYLLKGLSSSQAYTVQAALGTLRRISVRPKPEDPVPYRNAILAAGHLGGGSPWEVVRLLRHWTNGKQF